MRPLKFEIISRQVEQHLSAGRALPTINGLARDFRVSYETAWKACQTLVSRGVLVSSSGKRLMPRAQQAGNGAGECARAEDVLHAAIHDRIAQGIYIAGKPLPKSRHFTLSERISPSTVARAMHRLAREGLLHKEGKQWIAGPRPARPPEGLPRQPDTALMVLPGYQDWFHIYLSGFTQGYIVPFRNELVAHDTRIQPALRFEQPGGGFLWTLAGDAQMLAWAREAGPQYRGAFIQSVDFAVDKPGDLAATLCRLKKPVVLFDSADQENELTRTKIGVGRHYFRLRIDEQLAVDLAIKTLAGLGHTVVGVHGFDASAWAQRRLGIIKNAAARLCPSMRIIEAAPAEKAWDFVSADYATTLTLPTGIIHGDPRLNREYAQKLFTARQSLPQLLLDHAPTALISPNDVAAREHYLLLRGLGVCVPEHLSMISFDNLPQASMFPVSTIDFGFARLGYLAAHILIGDIPIRADRQGVISGIPKVIHQGSLGVPAGDRARFRKVLAGFAGG